MREDALKLEDRRGGPRTPPPTEGRRGAGVRWRGNRGKPVQNEVELGGRETNVVFM